MQACASIQKVVLVEQSLLKKQDYVLTINWSRFLDVLNHF